MDDTAIITTENLRNKIINMSILEYKNSSTFSKPIPLFKAIKDDNLDIKTIMRWTWQIAHYAYQNYKKNNLCLKPINVYHICVNENNDIDEYTMFKNSSSHYTSNSLSAAKSIIMCNSTILNYARINNRTQKQQKEFKIFETLYNNMASYSNINEAQDVVGSAFYMIDKLCEYVEAGLIEQLANI